MANEKMSEMAVGIIRLLGAFENAKTNDDAIDYLYDIVYLSEEIKEKALLNVLLIRMVTE